MATSVVAFTCTTPAGTFLPNPHIVNMDLGTLEVTRIRWRVPPGPRGTLSWFLAMSGAQVLPAQGGTAIVADNEWDEWVIDALPNTGTWQFYGLNSGTFDHSVYLEFFTEPVTAGIGGGIDYLASFPFDDTQVPTMWSGVSSGGVIVA